MYLYFDRNGTLKEIVNDQALRQGNWGVNQIWVYVDGRVVDGVSATYELPSGQIVGSPSDYYDDVMNAQIPYDAERDLRFFKYNQTYPFVVIDMSQDPDDLDSHYPLEEPGTVHCSLQATIGSDVLTLGTVNFEVEGTLPATSVAPIEFLSVADYYYLNKRMADTAESLAGKQDELVWDTEPLPDSADPVTSGGVYAALQGKQDTLTFDNAPTYGSDNPVKSGGVYTAIDNLRQNLAITNLGSLAGTTNLQQLAAMAYASPFVVTIDGYPYMGRIEWGENKRTMELESMTDSARFAFEGTSVPSITLNEFISTTGPYYQPYVIFDNGITDQSVISALYAQYGPRRPFVWKQNATLWTTHFYGVAPGYYQIYLDNGSWGYTKMLTQADASLKLADVMVSENRSFHLSPTQIPTGTIAYEIGFDADGNLVKEAK